MGFLRKIYENWIVKGNKVQMPTNLDMTYADMATSNLMNIINQIKEFSGDYNEKITEFKNMLNDGIIYSAVDSIATDASMIDEDKKMTVWVSCPEDPEWEEKINKFLLEDAKVNEITYALAFNLTAFGDAYLNTFYSDDQFRRIQRIGSFFDIEPVENYAHIYRYGIPSGYLKTNKDELSKTGVFHEKIMSEKDFVHFSLYNGLKKEKAVAQKANPYGELEQVEYTVRRGTSPVLEGARKSYRTKELLDGYLMMARLNHSQFFRLIGVEVGGLDTIQAQRLIKELKTKVTSAQNIDMTNRRMNTYSAPINSGAPIFYPIRSGIGALHVESVEGKEASALRSMLDVDRFDNQFFASMRTPKALLGQDMESPLMGQGPFTMIDVRYGRTVKLIQSALANGFRNLVNWKSEFSGEIPRRFDIIMTKVVTAEDEVRGKTFEIEMDRFNKAMEFAKEFAGDLNDEKKKLVLQYVFKNIFKDPNLADLFIPEDNTPPEPTDGDTKGPELDNDSPFGDSFDDDAPSFGDDSHFESTMDDMSGEDSEPSFGSDVGSEIPSSPSSDFSSEMPSSGGEEPDFDSGPEF